LRLGIRAGEIERESIAALARGYLDAHRLRAVGAVVVKQRLSAVLSVRPAGNLAAHSRGGALDQARHRRTHGVRPILIAQRAETLGAQPRASDLAAQVANDDLGNAAVVAQDCIDLAIDAVLAPVTHRRNEDAVVEDLARGGARGSRHQPADVRLVGNAGPE